MRKIVIANDVKKDFFQEITKLLNGEITATQFLKDNAYYDMVTSIYENIFKKLSDRSPMSAYIAGGVEAYNKLTQLNDYFDINHSHYDDFLLVCIAGQFLNYFRKSSRLKCEDPFSFARKIGQRLDVTPATPVNIGERLKKNGSDKTHVRLNDLIYRKGKKNTVLVREMGIDANTISLIRSGKIKCTKDILYLFAFSMKLSREEFLNFIEALKKNLTPEQNCNLDFSEKRDVILLREMDNTIMSRNLPETKHLSVLEYVNRYLEFMHEDEKIFPPVYDGAEQRKEKTILITGGLGFIGRNCMDYFYKMNQKCNTRYKICVLSRNISANTNLPEDIVCYSGKMDDELLLERILIENSVDYIIHLTAVSTKSECDGDAADAYYMNEGIADIIYDIILKNKIPLKGFILASTSLVYGGASRDINEYTEDTVIDANALENTYSRSKYIAEVKARDFARKGIPIFIARFTNVYGIYDMKPNRLIPAVIHKLEMNERPEVFVDRTSGKSERKDYIFSEDLAEAIGRMIQKFEQPDFTYDANDIIFNIGSGISCPVEDVIHTIAELMGKEIEPEVKEIDLGFREGYVCVDKMERQLGDVAKTGLREGLEKTLKWREKMKKEEF